MSGFGAFLVALAGPVVKKALTSLGVGVASYAALTIALNTAIDAAKSAFGGLTGDVLALVQMSGMPGALSIITGAMVARVSLMQLKKLEILK